MGCWWQQGDIEEQLGADADLCSCALYRTLFTAFGIFLYQLSTVLIVSVRSSKASKFGVVAFINLYAGIISWYLLGYAFSYGISLDSKL